MSTEGRAYIGPTPEMMDLSHEGPNWRDPAPRRLADMDPATASAALAHYRPRVLPGWERAALAPYLQALHEACQRILDAPDQHALDPTPDRCWRCDASPSSDDLGLCPPCKTSLTRRTP